MAAIFDRVADSYDQVGIPWFTPIAEALVREAAPRPGEHALDVGCGRGAALFPLAAAVGPSGRVTGIDLASRMVEATIAATQARGLTQVDVRVADAGAPGLPASSFDLLVSSLVLFFLPDPAAALAGWRDLLVPGGRLAISTFGARDPAWASLDGIFGPYLPPQMLDARTTGASGPFASDAGVEALVASAGFRDMRTAALDVEAVFTDVDQWRAWSWSHGQRAMWEAVPDTDHAAVHAAAAAHLERCRADDGMIRLAQRARFTLAAR